MLFIIIIILKSELLQYYCLYLTPKIGSRIIIV